MSELEYLEYEFYDAQAKWKTVPRAEQQIVLRHLLTLADRADLQANIPGAELARVMRRLATTIEQQIRDGARTGLIPEDCRLAYGHIKRSWRTQNVSARRHMLSQLDDMSHRRDIDAGFAAELSVLRHAISASVPA